VVKIYFNCCTFIRKGDDTMPPCDKCGKPSTGIWYEEHGWECSECHAKRLLKELEIAIEKNKALQGGG